MPINAAKASEKTPFNPLIIVVDSNVLIGNYSFNSHDMKNLFDFVKRTNSHMYLHKIVIDEVSSYIERNCSKLIADTNNNLRELEKWGVITTQAFDKEKLIKIALEKFEANFSKKDHETMFDRIILAPIDANDVDEAVRRLTKRIPPSSEKGEEFRDVMIWLNMLRFCREHFERSPIAFISNDKHFVDRNKKLKPELLEDVRKYCIDLEYLASLSEFLKKHSEPIEGIDRYWITSRIDILSLKRLILRFDFLQSFEYYNKLGQQIELENDAWTIKLNEFYLVKREDGLELNLIFKVIVEDGITIEHGRSNVSNIRVELVGNIVDDTLSIKDLSGYRFDEI